MSHPHPSRRRPEQSQHDAHAIRNATRARLAELDDAWAPPATHTKKTHHRVVHERPGKSGKITTTQPLVVVRGGRSRKKKKTAATEQKTGARTSTSRPKAAARETKKQHDGSRNKPAAAGEEAEVSVPRRAHIRGNQAHGYRPREVDAAKLALGAERAVYRRLNFQGDSLEEQQRAYRQQARRQEFERDESRLVSYAIGGVHYYTTQRPQADEVDEVRYQYEAKIRHEAEVRGRGFADPYSDDVHGLASPPVPSGHLAAVPKEEFDALFDSRRRATQQRGVGEVRFFDIPNYRDDGEWFRVDMRKEKQSQAKDTGGKRIQTSSVVKSSTRAAHDRPSSKNTRGCFGFLFG